MVAVSADNAPLHRAQATMKWITWTLLTLIATAQAAPDRLPRRGFFGVGLETIADGVRVTSVLPDSTAAAAGIVEGDIIAAVDGSPMLTSDAVISTMGHHKGGDPITVRISRNGERRDLPVRLKPYPTEQIRNATVTYSSVGHRSANRN
jgi:S1-C subfamily serine protease